MKAAERWEREYRRRPVEPPRPGDPVLAAALAHFGDLAGSTLLDLGCGTGTASLFFAAAGARVTSVDTSPAAIENLRAYCERHGIANIEARRARAQDIGELGSFDFVFGSMILHHIEPFDRFAARLRATLRPGGRGFFHENSASSGLLLWFRRHVVGRLWVPKHGDEEEFPLTTEEVDMLRRHFRVRTLHPEMLFFRLASDYLLRGRARAPFAALDRAAYRVPALRRYSYRQYVLLS